MRARRRRCAGRAHRSRSVTASLRWCSHDATNTDSVHRLICKSNQNFILIRKITLKFLPVLTSDPSAGVCLVLAWQCGRWPVGMMSLQKQWCHGIIICSLWQVGISFIFAFIQTKTKTPPRFLFVFISVRHLDGTNK